MWHASYCVHDLHNTTESEGIMLISGKNPMPP